MESALVSENSTVKGLGPGSSLESYCFWVTRGGPLLDLYHGWLYIYTIKAVSQYGQINPSKPSKLGDGRLFFFFIQSKFINWQIKYQGQAEYAPHQNVLCEEGGWR